MNNWPDNIYPISFDLTRRELNDDEKRLTDADTAAIEWGPYTVLHLSPSILHCICIMIRAGIWCVTHEGRNKTGRK